MRGFLIAGLMCGVTVPSLAQHPRRLLPGQKIRVRTMTDAGDLVRGAEGTILRVSKDSLTVRPLTGGAPEVFAPTAGSYHLVAPERRPYLVRGTLIGGFSGLIAAGLFTVGRGRECAEQADFCIQRTKPAINRGIALGVGGALAGIIIARFTTHDRWSSWPLGSTAAPTVSLGAPGLGLGLLVRF
jgi:hypothetical protein